MTNEDRIETLLRALFETFGETPTAGQILGYRLAFEGLGHDAVEQAVGRALRERKFLPRPSELRELAGEMTAATRAVIAWEVVRKAVHALGAYRSPDFDDPIVNATIRNMGGWVDFCGRDADDFQTWVRKDFERIYRQLAEKAGELGADTTKALAGIHGEAPRRVKVGLPPVATERRPMLEPVQ